MTTLRNIVPHLHVTSLQRFVVAHRSVCSWLLIAGSIMVFFIPYVLPNSTTSSLGAYAALSAVPVVLAAVLQRRLGNVVVTGIILLGLAIFNTVKDGLPWPYHEFVGWLSGGVGIFIFGLAIGQFSHMRQKISLANDQLAHTNAQLRVSHESLSDAHQELTMMEEEVRANNVALTEANGLLSDLASKDSLTRVLNHRVTIEVLERACARAVRQARPCAVVFFDLDHFKAVNDGYGHPVGDAILVELAQIAQQSLRQGDALGRWGGEEFLAILPATARAEALHIAERLCATVAAHLFAGGGGIRMTCSIGIALFPDDGDDREAVVAAADTAMYAAKRLGRNQVCMISDSAVYEGATPRQSHASREDIDLQGTIDALSALLQARDGYTGAHTATVSKLALKIGIMLGMSSAEARMVGIAGQLHDIGKIGIPDAILRKPGPLTEEEWEMMRVHPTLGAQIINYIPALKACSGAIDAHHERWDGTGYPHRLVGAAIPLGARIIAVVDAYDAIVTDRPYHQAQPASWALHEIWRCAGSQFDPDVVQALSQLCVAEQEAENAA